MTETESRILAQLSPTEWRPAGWLAHRVWGHKVTWSARSGQWQRMGALLHAMRRRGLVDMRTTEFEQHLWRARAKRSTEVKP